MPTCPRMLDKIKQTEADLVAADEEMNKTYETGMIDGYTTERLGLCTCKVDPLWLCFRFLFRARLQQQLRDHLIKARGLPGPWLTLDSATRSSPTRTLTQGPKSCGPSAGDFFAI